MLQWRNSPTHLMNDCKALNMEGREASFRHTRGKDSDVVVGLIDCTRTVVFFMLQIKVLLI